jgi:hypothetical protein
VDEQFASLMEDAIIMKLIELNRWSVQHLNLQSLLLWKSKI